MTKFEKQRERYKHGEYNKAQERKRWLEKHGFYVRDYQTPCFYILEWNVPIDLIKN